MLSESSAAGLFARSATTGAVTSGVLARINTPSWNHVSMTEGVLGIIGCPMLVDNLVWSLKDDADEKDITIIDTGNEGPLREQLDARSIPYRTMGEEDALSGGYVPTEGRFNLLVYLMNLGLHSVPEELRSKTEDIATRMQPYVDAIGFYLGTCGTYHWDIPKWCEEKGLKPSEMFRDRDGCPCDDCVGVCVGGGPRYLEMQKKYTGYLYMFPAMVANNDEFLMANNREYEGMMSHMTPEMMEVLGIEPGRDGYTRWLLSLGNYQHMLKLDNGIGDDAHYDEDLEKLKGRNHLDIVVAEPGWATTQPTVDLYARCKSLLDSAHRSG